MRNEIDINLGSMNVDRIVDTVHEMSVVRLAKLRTIKIKKRNKEK